MGRTIKKKDRPRLTILAVAGVVIMTFVIMLLSTIYDIHQVRGEISDCKEAIAQKESELGLLEQKKAYYESREFIEDAVRDNGYVNEGETVFVITD